MNIWVSIHTELRYQGVLTVINEPHKPLIAHTPNTLHLEIILRLHEESMTLLQFAFSLLFGVPCLLGEQVAYPLVEESVKVTPLHIFQDGVMTYEVKRISGVTKLFESLGEVGVLFDIPFHSSVLLYVHWQ